MNGFWGKILRVDLSTGSLTEELLNEQWARDYIGSTGLAARYLFDLVETGTDPSGPENPLIIMPGLLNGSSGPSVSRWGGATRSPYTGHYGDANGGAFFGAALKNSGFDGLIVTGISTKPVYLYLKNGEAELRDASALWGLDTTQTQDEIKSACDDKRTQVACIGPASENGVLYGNIMSEWGHCLGRAGLGCVMGSKKLKAIAVRGTLAVPLHDPDAFKAAAKEANTEVKEGFLTQWMHEGGTASWVDSAIAYGDGPTNYYTAPTMEDATHISGVTMVETCETGHTGCYVCPIRCRKVLEMKGPRFPKDKTEGPEYETVMAWGPMMGFADMEMVVHINELVNQYGYDSISSGAAAGYAYYLFEKGVISESDTGGLKLTWGNMEAALELVHQIGKNEGFGSILAEGTRRMAERYGRPPGEAVHTKGLEVPMHDPRAYHSMGLVYATAPRGADHNKSDAYQIDVSGGYPDLELNVGDRWGDDKADIVEKSQNFRALSDSLGICHFAIISFEHLLNMINTATGWKTTMDELLKSGERIFQLQRLLSIRLGTTAGDDRLPDILLQPIPDGGQEGHVPDMEKMLPEYYAIRGWDSSSGCPSQQRLLDLGMDDIVQSL